MKLLFFIIIFTCTSILFMNCQRQISDYELIAHQLSVLSSYLNGQSIENLRFYCQKVEIFSMYSDGLDYYSESINDYIIKMDKSACIKFILNNSLRHLQLLDIETFKSIVQPESNEFILTLNRSKLTAFAISAEAYVSEKNKIVVFGGLHDTIGAMSDKQIVEYLLKVVESNAELNNYKILENLSFRYGFFDKPVQVYLENNIKSNIYKKPRRDLIRSMISNR